MAYNFKNLADVELLNTMPENAKVIVEVDGATKRASLASVEALAEAPANTAILVEVDGEIKKVPSNKMISNIKPILFTGDYSDANCSCNVSYAEFKEAILAGLGACCFNKNWNSICTNMTVYFNDDESLEIMFKAFADNWGMAFEYRPDNRLLMKG